MKLTTFLATVSLAAGLAVSAQAGQLPGKYTNICLSKLREIGAKTIAVYDGSWQGLPQTLLVSEHVHRYGSAHGHIVVLAANPAKPTWRVPKRCTKYTASVNHGTITVLDGQRRGETISFKIDRHRMTGELHSSRINNHGTFPFRGAIRLQ